MNWIKNNILKNQADMDDKESLRKALKGAYAVFSVTNFWELLDAAKEKQQGINVADVAKEEGVQLFVWSNVIHAKKGLYLPSFRALVKRSVADDYSSRKLLMVDSPTCRTATPKPRLENT